MSGVFSLSLGERLGEGVLVSPLAHDFQWERARVRAFSLVLSKQSSYPHPHRSR